MISPRQVYNDKRFLWNAEDSKPIGKLWQIKAVFVLKNSLLLLSFRLKCFFFFFFFQFFFLFSSRCFCICYCSFLMAFTSLSQALDLDPKAMSCQNFLLHVALYFLFSIWPEVSFFSAYFVTLDLGFLCAINLFHPSCNGNGAVLGAALEAVWPEAGLCSRGWSCLAQQWCASSASSTGALKMGCQLLSWSPWGGFAVAHRITSGLRFLLLCYLAWCLWPHICSIVCKGESNEGSYWWAVFLQMIVLCLLRAVRTSSYLLFCMCHRAPWPCSCSGKNIFSVLTKIWRCKNHPCIIHWLGAPWGCLCSVFL